MVRISIGYHEESESDAYLMTTFHPKTTERALLPPVTLNYIVWISAIIDLYDDKHLPINNNGRVNAERVDDEVIQEPRNPDKGEDTWCLKDRKLTKQRKSRRGTASIF